MTGETPNQYWLITWRFIAPIVMAVLFVASVLQCFSKPTTYFAYDEITVKFLNKEVNDNLDQISRNGVSNLGNVLGIGYGSLCHSSNVCCLVPALLQDLENRRKHSSSKFLFWLMTKNVENQNQWNVLDARDYCIIRSLFVLKPDFEAWWQIFN